MADIHERYYDQDQHWKQDYLKNDWELKRIKDVVFNLPKDYESLLDVGCGNGAFLSYLKKLDSKKRTVGVDISPSALKYFDGESRTGSITDIPYDDSSFDLVTAMEVIEHMTAPDYKKALAELERVAKKYILVTVPNDEPLESVLVQCPMCFCNFSNSFHMHSFNYESMNNLFESFSCVKSVGIGPEKQILPFKRSSIYQMYRYGLRKPAMKATAICPQCHSHIKKTDSLSPNRMALH